MHMITLLKDECALSSRLYFGVDSAHGYFAGILLSSPYGRSKCVQENIGTFPKSEWIQKSLEKIPIVPGGQYTYVITRIIVLLPFNTNTFSLQGQTSRHNMIGMIITADPSKNRRAAFHQGPLPFRCEVIAQAVTLSEICMEQKEKGGIAEHNTMLGNKRIPQNPIYGGMN